MFMLEIGKLYRIKTVYGTELVAKFVSGVYEFFHYYDCHSDMVMIIDKEDVIDWELI